MLGRKDAIEPLRVPRPISRAGVAPSCRLEGVTPGDKGVDDKGELEP
jgi:hypothetical protein